MSAGIDLWGDFFQSHHLISCRRSVVTPTSKVVLEEKAVHTRYRHQHSPLMDNSILEKNVRAACIATLLEVVLDKGSIVGKSPGSGNEEAKKGISRHLKLVEG